MPSAGGAAASELHVAAASGAAETARALIEQGASPDVRDGAGRTPLHLAAAGGHQATGQALLELGADVNARDAVGRTPLDLAEAGGHSGLARFLAGMGGIAAARGLRPTLEFGTLARFESEIGEPALLLDSDNVCFFVPRRREKEARIVFGYLVTAYAALHRIVGVHTRYKLAVYAFPKGNRHGWGGTSECSIEYDDTNLDLAAQPKWTQYRLPHVSGYIEEMAHNFVGATHAQFGWEMLGWSLGAEVAQAVAGNPILTEEIRSTREGQRETLLAYARNRFVLPESVPANQCDRIHGWLLHLCAERYGPRFWHDLFREIRRDMELLAQAGQLGDADRVRNRRYQITIDCIDRLPGIEFKRLLAESGVSLTVDVRSLRPEAPGWDRRLAEREAAAARE